MANKNGQAALEDDLLSIAEAGYELGVTYQRVQQIIGDGGLQTVRIGKNGRFVRIYRSELRRYKESREVVAT